MSQCPEAVFDCYCKHVLRNSAYDYYRELKRRRAVEVCFEACWDLPPIRDTYLSDYSYYNVFGVEIPIAREDVVCALNRLPDSYRTIVLGAYCLDLPDRVLADRLHLVRRTVAYRRLRALELLRGALGRA